MKKRYQEVAGRGNPNGELAQLPLRHMTQDDLRTRFERSARTARHLVGTTVGDDGQICALNTGVEAFFTKMAKGLSDPESIKQRNEFMAKCEKDPEARKQFCALQLKTYNNYLMAEMAWIAYFCQITTLPDDGRPMVQNHYDKEIKCYYVGADGKPKEMKVFFDDTEVALPLRTLATPLMKYKVNDIYRGNIVDQAVRSLTLTRDLGNKMENEMKLVLLKGLQGAGPVNGPVSGGFTFTGLKANWPFVANSYINTANLPATNNINIAYPKGGSVNTVVGSFDFPVLDDIINYGKLLNAVRLPGTGDFRPTGRIRVPSTHIRNFGTFAAGSAVPGSASTAAAAPSSPEVKIFEDGWGGVHYKGIDWVFEPDATLDPTVNTCYPEFTVKPAEVFLKPSQDREFVRTGEQDPQLFATNEEQRAMKKVFYGYMNSAMLIYFAAFNY